MNIFGSVGLRKPKLNKFNLSYERKMSLNMGDLVPVMVQEILPGDNFRVNTEVFLRFMPMLAPIMHRVNVICEYFFVPNRLTWNASEDDSFETFITGGPDGTDAPEWPNILVTETDKGVTEPGRIWDYMGGPDLTGFTTWVGQPPCSALPFRAYQMIYNEYYRDQNTEAEIVIEKTGGSIVAADPEWNELMTLRRSAWEKDAYTSALPWTQRGAPVTLPVELSGYAPVVTTGLGGTSSIVTATENPGGISVGYGIGIDAAAPSGADLYADLSSGSATSVTIEALRFSVRLQEWLEKNARGGARYIEQILSHFGVVSSDARLQRPEYLGGYRAPVNVSEVMSTSQSTEVGNEYPMADISGRAISAAGFHGFKKRFEEHGFVIGIMRVLPRTAYQQGLPRYLGARSSKFEYFWPEFAHLGEQAIKLRELYTDPVTPGALGVTDFGYQQRYHEYKYNPSTIHGQMKTTLAHWHMGRIFMNPPVLIDGFVMANPTDRIFNVLGAGEDDHKLVCQVFHKVDALRPIPIFAVPHI